MSYSKCVDILKLSSFPEYDVLYCDPPWGNRMVRFFETQMRKEAGLVINNDINDILNQLGRLASKEKPLFIEYSVKESDSVIDVMRRHGHQFHSRTISLYTGRKTEYATLQFNSDIHVPNRVVGDKVLKHIAKELKPKTIFDPFAGIGFSASIFMKFGINYIGYEINPVREKRLAKIISEHEAKQKSHHTNSL